jgi:hypothetical protein
MFGSLFSAPEPAAAVSPPAPAVGKVEVAEAIRVPLSGENGGDNITPARNNNVAFSTAGESSGVAYWAQISYFDDEASAHNFYEEFRNTYPDISDGLRMRITRPYASAANRGGRVTLRVGAFTTITNVDTLCALAGRHGLGCVSVRDTSAAIPSYMQEEKNARHYTPDEVEHAKSSNFLDAPASSGVTYWVQLGTFDSEDEAWDKWKELKQANKKLVGKTNASVVQPESSFARTANVFRLRAGPFSNREGAYSMCNRLTRKGEDCVVLSE